MIAIRTQPLNLIHDIADGAATLLASRYRNHTEGAAIAAAKILALEDAELQKSVSEYQLSKKKEVEKANESVVKLK